MSKGIQGNQSQNLASGSIENQGAGEAPDAVARECAAQIINVLNAQYPAIEWPFLTIAALIAPYLGGGGSAWQPIETAPKDSSWILGLTLAGRQVVVRWGGGVWEDDNRLCRDPIKWMPLPPVAIEATHQHREASEAGTADQDSVEE